MKTIYMKETLNLIYNTKGQEEIDKLLNSGEVVDSEELKTSYLVIEEKIEEDE